MIRSLDLSLPSLTFLLGVLLCGPLASADDISSAVAGIVTAEGERETRVSPSGKASIQILNRGANAFLGILTLQGGAKVPLHRDVSEEHIFVLEGTGSLFMEGKKTVIKAGDSILMPAGVEVRFENGEGTLVVVQVFAGTKSAEKYDSWVERRD